MEIGRSFMEGRLKLRAGGFYRQLNFRDLFTVITDARDKGVLGNASFNLDTRDAALYGLRVWIRITPYFGPAFKTARHFVSAWCGDIDGHAATYL